MSDKSYSKRLKSKNQDHASFTIEEWCARRRISLAMFYKLDGQGLAPKTHYAGARRLISAEADAAWLSAREAENDAA